MTVIDDYASIEENKDFITQFEKLYNENFPIEEERELFQDIMSRIANRTPPITIMVFENDGKKLMGACITDYYDEEKIVMPVYMVVRPEYRRMGLGKQLFEGSVSYFDHQHVFIEIDDPEKVTDSVIDPIIRLSMYSGMGFEVVPIAYRQPPLKRDGEWCDSLILMHRGEKLTKNVLCRFLKVFYQELGAGETDEFRKIMEEVKKSAVPE